MTPFEHFCKRMMNPWTILGYTVLMGLLFLYFDPCITLFFNSFNLGYFEPVLRVVTSLGKPTLMIGLFLILALIFRYVMHQRRWEMRAWFIGLCTLVPSVIVLGLKMFFGRARPELLLSQGIYGFHWFQDSRPFWSFPSGHTATMMGCVFSVCIIWPRYRWLFLTAGGIVMLSRVLLLQHYLSDVMVSAYLALIEVWMLQWALERYAPSFMKEVRG